MNVLKFMGWTTVVMALGISTCAAMPKVFGEEVKQTEVWSLNQEEQDLRNVTNGDVIGDRGKDGV
ncbi:MAG: hypothetical protein AABZ43_06765, partial [Planctomycetota bacterium]